MKWSTDVRYAVRLLFELRQAGKPLSLAKLSDKTGITLRAMETVHAKLKERGITDGNVGAKGGIFLTSSLDAVSLGDLVDWFDEGVQFSVCCGNKANDCPHQPVCATAATWLDVSKRVHAVLDGISLESVLKKYTMHEEIPLQKNLGLRS